MRVFTKVNVILINTLDTLKILLTKVVEWQKNGGDWWRDTEFMCPATLRAVCNLQTMVINCMLELHELPNLHAILYLTNILCPFFSCGTFLSRISYPILVF